MSTETSTLAPGAFCWVDLATSDPAAAKKFYSDLFGWQVTDVPGGAYTMFAKDGKDTAGMMEINAEMKQMGVPPNWMSYVYVSSTDDIAKRAAELGATILKGPIEMMGMGRMAVVQDPTGAVFGAWQPLQKLGDALYNKPGALCWNELWTSDTTKAESFYTRLFGWVSKSENFGSMPYTTFQNQGRPNGGMMTIPEDAKKMGAPPNWMVYFAVENCDAAVARATAGGARVMAPAMEIPTVGRFAVLADPQGAAFSVIQMAPRPQ